MEQNVKYIRAGLLFASILALAGCSNSQGLDNQEQSTPRTLTITQDGETQATYTLDASGNVLVSQSLGEYNVWTTRNYDYDTDGDIGV